MFPCMYRYCRINEATGLSQDAGRSPFFHAHVTALIASWVARRKLLRERSLAHRHPDMTSSIWNPSRHILFLIIVVTRRLAEKTREVSNRLCGLLGWPQKYDFRAV